MVVESQLKIFNFRVTKAEVIAWEAQERVQAIEAKTQTTELQVIYVGVRAVEEHKKFKNFKDEVVQGAYDAFQLKFMECKKKVIKALSELNLDSIITIEPEQEEEGAEEGETCTTEVAIEEAADIEDKQAAIQETITKVIVEAKAMIDAVMQAFDMGSTLVAGPKE